MKEKIVIKDSKGIEVEVDIIEFAHHIEEYHTSVAHQSFNRVGILGARKLLAFSLSPVKHGHRQLVLDKFFVHTKHSESFFLSFTFSFMSSVTLLPQELSRS